jgi:hypothetical protein
MTWHVRPTTQEYTDTLGASSCSRSADRFGQHPVVLTMFVIFQSTLLTSTEEALIYLVDIRLLLARLAPA